MTLQGACAIDAVARTHRHGGTWEAQQLVTSALAAMHDYANNNAAQAVFLSPEGYIMHQTMDCNFMCPYTKSNYWPRDSQGRLPMPVWYRDLNGSSRVPCTPTTCFQETDQHALLVQECHQAVGDQVLLPIGDRQELADYHRRRGGRHPGGALIRVGRHRRL